MLALISMHFCKPALLVSQTQTRFPCCHRHQLIVLQESLHSLHFCVKAKQKTLC